MNPTLSAWIEASRPRTLPLALAGVLMGSALAWSRGAFRADVFAGAALTTLLLQILSNWANDYGDYRHGVDGAARAGPPRTVQRGAIRPGVMLRMVAALAAVTALSGLWLLRRAGVVWRSPAGATMLGLGLLALAAALGYTMGKKPYGYLGLGDLFVFLFFGLLSVCGVVFLYTGAFEVRSLWPAVAVGALSTGVLNLNNLRDEAGDRLTGKRTLVVRLGGARARRYHLALLAAPFLSMAVYAAQEHWPPAAYLFLIWIVPVGTHARRVWRERDATRLDPELKRLALLTLGFTLLVALSLGIARHA